MKCVLIMRGLKTKHLNGGGLEGLGQQQHVCRGGVPESRNCCEYKGNISEGLGKGAQSTSLAIKHE